MSQLVLIGKLEIDYDSNVGIRQAEDGFASTLAEEIGRFIEKDNNRLSRTYDKEVDENLGYSVCTSQDNIQLRYYTSDNEIKSKEDIEEKYLQKILGSIDISVENIGYSEYTITGCSTENFTLGGHNLEEEFDNYLGKYVCIIVDKED